MSAEDLLREEKLDEALADLQNQVRSDPSNASLRVFLFQLLSVMGQWERALTQLNVAGELDAANLAMVQTYREALQCESLRSTVFAGKRSPLIFGDPEKWMALAIEALNLTACGEFGKAQAMRSEAFEMAPVTSGSIDGEAFEWIADADSRMGPMLEAVINGRYYWVPFHRIAAIKFEAPEDLRDVVWTPAWFTWANGGQTVGLIPTRYAGSESSDDTRVQMARKTDWVACDADTWLGLGQRVLATDANEYSLMDVREISLNTEELVDENEERSSGSTDG